MSWWNMKEPALITCILRACIICFGVDVVLASLDLLTGISKELIAQMKELEM